MKSLQRLFYVSRAVGDSHDHVGSILPRCRLKNRRLDITGMLAFSGDYFAQVLEGHADVLATLAQQIQADARHTDMRIIFREPVKTRDYGDWAMGYAEGFGAAQQIGQLAGGARIADVHQFVRKLFADPRL